MAEAGTGAQPPEEKDKSEAQDIPSPAPEYEPEPVEFLDRVIAFVVLIGPFSYMVAWLQSEFADAVSLSVHNMIMLVGIIAFLVLVGYASKRVHRIRKRFMS
jgi:hypothetical protein